MIQSASRSYLQIIFLSIQVAFLIYRGCNINCKYYESNVAIIARTRPVAHICILLCLCGELGSSSPANVFHLLILSMLGRKTERKSMEGCSYFKYEGDWFCYLLFIALTKFCKAKTKGIIPAAHLLSSTYYKSKNEKSFNMHQVVDLWIAKVQIQTALVYLY